jgi:hypothetical protein
MKKARGILFGPIQKSARGPAKKSRIGTLFLPHPHWQRAPPISHLQSRSGKLAGDRAHAEEFAPVKYHWLGHQSFPFSSLQIARQPCSFSPPIFPAQITARLVELLVRGARVRCSKTPIPTIAGVSAASFLYQYLLHARALLIMSSRHLIVQQIDHSVDARRSPSPTGAPVASPHRPRTQPRYSSTPSSSPRHSAPRQPLEHHQISLEHHHHWPPERSATARTISGELAETLCKRVCF